MKTAYFFYLAILVSWTTSESLRAEDESLCVSGETMIATCQIERNKTTMSICAADGDKVVYRSGTPEKLDPVIEFTQASPLTRWVDLGTYTTYFGYRAGEYAYILGVPEEKYGAIAFFSLTERNKRLDTIDCADNSFGEKRYLSRAIKDIDDEFARANKSTLP